MYIDQILQYGMCIAVTTWQLNQVNKYHFNLKGSLNLTNRDVDHVAGH